MRRHNGRRSRAPPRKPSASWRSPPSPEPDRTARPSHARRRGRTGPRRPCAQSPPRSCRPARRKDRRRRRTKRQRREACTTTPASTAALDQFPREEGGDVVAPLGQPLGPRRRRIALQGVVDDRLRKGRIEGAACAMHHQNVVVVLTRNSPSISGRAGQRGDRASRCRSALRRGSSPSYGTSA